MGVVKKNDSTLGIDVGGTKIYAARYDGDSSVLHETTCRTQAKKGKDVVLDSLQKAIAEVFDPSVSAIGVSWAGLVDSQNGIICNSPNIIGFEDHSIKNTIEQWFGVPVFVENDARLFVFAEQRIGSARGAENVLLGSFWERVWEAALLLTEKFIPDHLVLREKSVIRFFL
jgi:glucokinase